MSAETQLLLLFAGGGAVIALCLFRMSGLALMQLALVLTGLVLFIGGALMLFAMPVVGMLALLGSLACAVSVFVLQAIGSLQNQ